MSLKKIIKGYSLDAFLAYPFDEEKMKVFMERVAHSFDDFNFYNGTGFFFNDTNTTKILKVIVKKEELEESLNKFKELVSFYNKLFDQKHYLISVNKVIIN